VAPAGTALRQGLEQVTLGEPLVPDPVNPKEVEAPGAIVRFQSTFLAVTVDPDVVCVALQRLLMVLPLPSVHFAVQPLMAADPELLTVTSPWKPPDQELTVL